MNIHGKDIKIFAANSTVRVSEQIAECLGLPLGKSEVSTFSDGEITVSLFIGKFAAKLDDVLNYIPARISGILVIISAFILR